MYPEGDLNELAARKALLRVRIALRRAEVNMHSRAIVQPLLLVDHAVDAWRRISPWVKLAAVPLGFLAQRSVARRIGPLRRVLRWAPAALSAVRMFRGLTSASAAGGRAS